MAAQKTTHLPYMWLLSDGKAGHINQLRALAHAMGAAYTEIDFNDQNFHLQVLNSKKPDLILSIARAGRKAQSIVNREYSAQCAGAQRIHLMASKTPNPLFDREIIMAHDVPAQYCPKSRQMICHIPPSPFGAPQADTAPVALPELGGKRAVALLLGGENKDFNFTPRQAFALGQKLEKILHKQDISLYISPSRRTRHKASSALVAGLGATEHSLWDNTGANPYASMIARASSVIVTEDSISMLSDIAHAGKPLYIVELATKFLRTGRKYRRYRDHLIAEGYARLLRHECIPFETPPCTATQDLAQKIMLAHHCFKSV